MCRIALPNTIHTALTTVNTALLSICLNHGLLTVQYTKAMVKNVFQALPPQ